MESQEFEYNDIDPIDAAQLAAQAAQEAEASKELDVDKFFLDFTAPIPRPTPVIYDPTNPNRIIVSEQNIFTIIGEAKSYKSFCASLLTMDFFHQHSDRECILIDTEQAAWNVQNVAKRVCDGMGWNYNETFQSGRLRIAHLRPYSKEERLAAVEAILNKYHPYLCIVDGIRDLVESVNDDVVCSEVIDKFMKWSEIHNCAIGTILHTNKDGETAKGHMGGELLAKSEIVLLCKKREGGGAKVICNRSRNQDIDSFEFDIDEKYVPHRVTHTKQEEEQIHCGNTKETNALRSLKVKAVRPKAEWVNDIRIAASCAASTAEKYFSDYVQFGYLIPADREMHFFTHFKFEGATPVGQQEDTQTTIDPSNSMGDPNEPPF